MSENLSKRLYDELIKIVLIDPHTHINPHAPGSTSLADILGYHYYTELAHSNGLPREQIEEPGLSPKDKVGRLVPALAGLRNTVQYSWFEEICTCFFGFSADEFDEANWERCFDQASKKMAALDWEDQVLTTSRIEQVFLTNDFDDPLSGFNTDRYIPCLRTDDLVFHLDKPATQARFAKATGQTLGGTKELRAGLEHLFQHFVRSGARACAISLPPGFSPTAVSASSAEPALQAAVATRPLSADEARLLSSHVFWTLAELCRKYHLPFDLMIGVNRRVYEAGVFQGQDLFNSHCSLIQYRELFNAFPEVTFPVSVLASCNNQELVSYSWIFPNVVPNGHWWYSNIPAYIEIDCRSRLQAVPAAKQIGYYSDMYKLEFALPKFNMYRRILAGVLAQDFVVERGWSEEKALDLGRQVLRGNVERVFPAVSAN